MIVSLGRRTISEKDQKEKAKKSGRKRICSVSDAFTCIIFSFPRTRRSEHKTYILRYSDGMHASVRSNLLPEKSNTKPLSNRRIYDMSCSVLTQAHPLLSRRVIACVCVCVCVYVCTYLIIPPPHLSFPKVTLWRVTCLPGDQSPCRDDSLSAGKGGHFVTRTQRTGIELGTMAFMRVIIALP